MALRTITAYAAILDHNDGDLPLFPCETIQQTLEHEARRLTRNANERLGAADYSTNSS